jgi:hypothetical protein
MRYLAAYIEQKNNQAKVFGGHTINIQNLDAAKAQELFTDLCYDLEPEVLTCDGELTFLQVRERSAMLRGAKQDLRRMGFVCQEPETA